MRAVSCGEVVIIAFRGQNVFGSIHFLLYVVFILVPIGRILEELRMFLHILFRLLYCLLQFFELFWSDILEYIVGNVHTLKFLFDLLSNFCLGLFTYTAFL